MTCETWQKVRERGDAVSDALALPRCSLMDPAWPEPRLYTLRVRPAAKNPVLLRTVRARLMLSCSQAADPRPRTEMPSSPTACSDWLPLRMTYSIQTQSH